MRNVINHILALLLAIATLLIGSAPTIADAQTISNIATIQWDAGTNRIIRNSNQVDLVVEQPQPVAPTLKTYQLDSSPAGHNISVPTTICQGSSGAAPVTLGGVFSGTSLLPASAVQTTEIRAGEPLIVEINSALDNLSSTTIDTLTVRLETQGGDSEILVFSESGPNTGIFIGIIRTSAIPANPVRNDCLLSVRPGDALILTGLRASDGSLIANSPVQVLVDPFGIVFDSGDGAPIAGSSVTLVDAATGQPAQVFGDDGVSSFPATIVTGSSVTDSGGNIYVFPPGDYRFPFVRAGSYRLLVQPPLPYTIPSTSFPPIWQACAVLMGCPSQL